MTEVSRILDGQVALVAVEGVPGLAMKVCRGKYDGVVFAADITGWGEEEDRIGITYQVLESPDGLDDPTKDEVFKKFVCDIMTYLLLISTLRAHEILGTDWANITLPEE